LHARQNIVYGLNNGISRTDNLKHDKQSTFSSANTIHGNFEARGALGISERSDVVRDLEIADAEALPDRNSLRDTTLWHKIVLDTSGNRGRLEMHQDFAIATYRSDLTSTTWVTGGESSKIESSGVILEEDPLPYTGSIGEESPVVKSYRSQQIR
jgi:hypothetical protein